MTSKAEEVSKPTLEMRVLRRAAELLGGERELARRLHVPMRDLFMWLKGDERPTKVYFLCAVDLLLELGESGIPAEDLNPPAPGRDRGTSAEGG